MTTASERQRQETAEQDAIAWLLRVDAPDATEADWLSLQAWLETAPENRLAYDRVERLSAEFRSAAPDLVAALDSRTGPALPRRSRDARRTAPLFNRRAFAGFATATAAAAAAITVFVAYRPEAPAPAVAYQTGKGENREVTLADGSRVHLNSGSRIAVRFERARRNVELVEGEAAFDVAHDTARPFMIAAGERDIRVVGTEFDVLRHEGALRVTVRRGVVAVESPDTGGARPVLLRVGDQLDHRAGARLWTVQKVDPEAAFAWKHGDLVYSDRPLDEVVSDLNRYFGTPVQVTGPAASLRFSGVLKLEDEAAMLRRLEAFLPVKAERSGQGVTLSLREAHS